MNRLERAQRAIAERALGQVGTPFRLFGRSGGKALDCVGLALLAMGPEWQGDTATLRYSLKGDQLAKARRCFAGTAFQEIEVQNAPQEGDLALVCPGPSQLHFMIFVRGGWVHADAGLGRVVLRPGAPPWPVRCIWRLNGK